MDFRKRERRLASACGPIEHVLNSEDMLSTAACSS